VVSIFLLITTVFDVAQSQEKGAANREEAFRQIVQSYVQAGKVGYNKGYYEQAVKTFVMAQGYQEYLTVAGREELRAHLEKSRAAVAKRKLALEKFQAVDKLIKQNKLIEAKTHLESLRKNEYLTKDEQTQIATVLKQIELQVTNDKASPQITAEKPGNIKEEITKTGEQQKRQNNKIADLYRSSMKFYRASQLEKAREGLVEVATSSLIPPRMKKDIEGRIAKIDSLLSQRITSRTASQEKKSETITVIEPKVFNFEATESEVNEPEVIELKPAQPQVTAIKVASPVTGEGTYIEQTNKKSNILRTYTGTVVNNAITKANSYMDQGQFDKAKKEIEAAEFTVNENQIHLGDVLFKEYSNNLKTINNEIVEKQSEKARQDEQEKRKAAIEAQNQFRKQADIDRQKRISELMENAIAYQEQQQYEAALGQLVSLLALDPQNNEALILKDTLEDMVFFRKQLEVEKEADRQRADILLKTDESGIPYAEELTYPKNWREIVQKPTRQPDKPIGLDPADAAVYEQLETIVDLSDLTSSTSFADVIMQLKGSVDPPLQIQPNWKDLLEYAELEQTTPAGMDPLTGIKLRKALEVLLAGVSSEFAEVSYVVDEGIILIATVDTLPKKLVTRVYDITDLVGEPANYGGMQGLSMGRMVGMMSGGGMGGMSGGMGGYGGGMSGGMGGMSGGMGGYGGGSMMGGGMMGGGMMGGGQGGFFQAQSLVQLIQESIEPESWFDLSDTGEGTVTPYPTRSPKKLAVYATHEVHREIDNLLKELRKSLGHQVSIEARFLVVSENFLEDIGLDIDFTNNLGSNWGQVTFEQDSAFITNPEPTSIPLSLGGIGAAANIAGGYGSILDDLQVSFLLRATIAHRDAKSLDAPLATVLSGESASFTVNRQMIFALPPVQTQGSLLSTPGGTQQQPQGTDPRYLQINPSTSLSITPIITHDKKNVLLGIITTQNQFLGMRTTTIETPLLTGVGAGQTISYDVQLPDQESSTMMTRVSVPDCGTLLLGGQRITSEVETEAGVPILSKIPLIGRLFSNRSKVKDSKILLILVKPVIILQEEREAEAIAAMESEL
jgi:Flp pilus assembly secretin CpaC/tetratricopeptide (TPR) repeat protein